MSQGQGQDVYIAEKILKKRNHKGTLQYLIKWQDYSMKDCTWEPADNILCPELLTSFQEELKRKKDRKKSNKKKPKRSSQASISTPEPQQSSQENGHQSPPAQSLSPTPSTQETKSRTPSPALEPQECPPETADQSPIIRNSPSPLPPPPSAAKRPPKVRTPTPKPEEKAENGIQVAAPKQQHQQPQQQQQSQQPSTPVKSSSPPTRTLEVQTSPRPQLSSLNAVHDRPFTVITDVTVNSRTITISESLAKAL